MKQTYRILAGLIVLGVLAQAAAIAFGWFDAIVAIESGTVIDANYEPNAGHVSHHIVGMYVMPLLGLIFLISSFLATKAVPRARKWAGIVFGVIVLQISLAFAAFMVTPVLGALHELNALVVFGCAVRAALLMREGRAAGTGTAAGAVPAQRTGTSSTGSSLPV
ncbi:MAG: hypothetical protein M3Q22_01255 [Actinomycetota bacterium]|nr:hypothetical protein [Actinomycetota bacterium]